MAHLCVHVCTHSCVCVYLCVHRPEFNLGCHSKELTLFFLREGLSLTLRDAWIMRGRLVNKPISASPKHTLSNTTFYRGSRTQTWIFKLTQQVLYHLRYPQPWIFFLNIFPIIYLCVYVHRCTYVKEVREFILGVGYLLPPYRFC